MLNTERAIKATVGFRRECSKQSVQVLSDLMQEESARLSHEIHVVLSSLRIHYEHTDASGYSYQEVVDALTTFMHRTRDTEQADLNHKYNAIHAIPMAALWSNLPDHAVLPESVIRPI